MQIKYDPQVDAAYLAFRSGTVQVRTIRVTEDLAIDLGPDEQVYGIEVLDASKNLGLRMDTGSVPVEMDGKEKGKSYSLGAIRARYPRAYEKWTDEELATLQAEFSRGKPIKELANRLGRQPSAIESRLQKLGLI